MRLLLDTHVVLWFSAGDPRLGVKARQAIDAPENTAFVSAVSVWELAIKQSLGKLELPDGFHARLLAGPFQMLPVTAEHALALAGLPWLHKDPFDRMLVAQCQLEGLTLVTADTRLQAYPMPLLNA